MKLTPFLILTLAAAWLAGCSPKDQPPAPAATTEKGEPESRVKRGTNGEVTVTLDAATQKLMGLQTSTLEPASLKPEVKGYGRVLDSAPLAALAAELVTAQAANEASQAELARLRTLAAQQNASERAMQAASAAAARDQAQVESARLRLMASWGSAIAERKDLAAFIRSLGDLSSALVEIDLPAGEPIHAAPRAGRLLSLDGGQPIEAQFLGPAPAVDPQMQGHGYLFLVSPNPARLAPGAAVTGFLELPGEAQPGVAVPREALLRFGGATWVYRQKTDDVFERVEVSLEHPLTNGWFVRAGLKIGDKVVTVGPQQILSEELKGQAE